MISYECFNGFHVPISVCYPCVINWHNPVIPANSHSHSFSLIGLLKLFGGGLEWTLTAFKGIIHPPQKDTILPFAHFHDIPALYDCLSSEEYRIIRRYYVVQTTLDPIDFFCFEKETFSK